MNRRSIDFKYYFLKGINPTIKFLIFFDILLIGSAGMLGPVFALFIEGFIEGGDAAVAGMAMAIYLVSKSVFQIPTAVLIDKIRGEKDDYNLMVLFSLLSSFIPLFYLVINQPWQLYLVQFFLGIFTAVTFPSFMAIFTRHIDKTREGTEWGVYFTFIDLSSAALAAIGGYIAATLGFSFLIISVVVVSIIGCLFLLPIRPYLKKPRTIDNLNRRLTQ